MVAWHETENIIHTCPAPVYKQQNICSAENKNFLFRERFIQILFFNFHNFLTDHSTPFPPKKEHEFIPKTADYENQNLSKPPFLRSFVHYILFKRGVKKQNILTPSSKWLRTFKSRCCKLTKRWNTVFSF